MSGTAHTPVEAFVRAVEPGRGARPSRVEASGGMRNPDASRRKDAETVRPKVRRTIMRSGETWCLLTGR